MTREVYLGGRGLACALGSNLDAGLQSLHRGAPSPGRIEAAPGNVWPYFAIPDTAHDQEGESDWYARAERIVRRCVDACGGHLDRDAPLYLASSSLNVGALEDGAPYLPDCQAFVEEVARWLDWRGEVIWVSTACTSAINALLSAQRRIRNGAIDSALVLGLELKNRFSVAGFGAMQLLDATSARPLAADRGGLVLGEAVAALEITARPGRWRVCGGANVIDGSDPAGASPDAVGTMLGTALRDAGLSAGDIDLVKLQAAGSPHNDAAEIDGLRKRLTTLPPLVSLKHYLGHTLGAAGAAEIALLTACLENDWWPRTMAMQEDAAIGATLAAAKPARVRYLAASILGFGGGHACAMLEDTGRGP